MSPRQRLDETSLPGLPNRPWTQRELDLLHEIDLDLLHEMVEDYGHSKWLKRRIKVWMWVLLGTPAGAWAFWEPITKLVNAIRGVFHP